MIVYNHCWSDSEAIHWCTVGCLCNCTTDEDCLQLAIDIAMELLMAFPDPPLLYRWKHFTEASAYVFRGVAYILLRLLPFVAFAMIPGFAQDSECSISVAS